jgi:type IV pilus assembly protein PilO
VRIDINDLTLENLDRWPVIVKISVIGIIFGLIIAFGYIFANKQQLSLLEKARQQELELKQTFILKQQLAANYSAYKIQLEQIKKTFGTMLRQLPSTTEVPGLLEDISQAGVASGLTFKLFKPQPEIKHEFYTELPIQIQILGHYHQLAEFVSKIVNLDRIVTLHDFNITREVSSENKTIINHNLIMDITAKTYRYTENRDNP